VAEWIQQHAQWAVRSARPRLADSGRRLCPVRGRGESLVTLDRYDGHRYIVMEEALH
jgi:hypothetical protein